MNWRTEMLARICLEWSMVSRALLVFKGWIRPEL